MNAINKVRKKLLFLIKMTGRGIEKDKKGIEQKSKLRKKLSINNLIIPDNSALDSAEKARVLFLP